MATELRRRNAQLERYKRFHQRQDAVRFGPDYQAAIAAVRGEAPERSGAGVLPAAELGRSIHALSWPEKVAAALALYSGVLELHDQHVYYPKPMLHPLAFHHLYQHLEWPATDGTYSIAEQLGLAKWHPRVWDTAAAPRAQGGSTEAAGEPGGWHIGCWVGDFLLYRRDAQGHPYILFWEVRPTQADHALPGGDFRRRSSAKSIEGRSARNTICAAYAEQLGSRIVAFNCDEVPEGLARALVSLCRNQAADIDLPVTAVAELLHAYREAVGTDIPPDAIARKLVTSGEDFLAAKNLLDHAVWQRHVRVDLHKPLLWNRPLLPESLDVLVEFRHLLSAK